MPFQTLTTWLDEEKLSGAPNPCQAVLSTATADATPHGRVIAIREMSENRGLLFFTQRNVSFRQGCVLNPPLT